MSVLCYHAVCDEWTAPMSLRVDQFEAQCRWLSRYRRVVDVETAAENCDGRGRLPARMTALTFDDGFVDNYHAALPILRRHAFPAMLFAVAATLSQNHPVDWVDNPPPFPLSTLTADQILEMADSGVSIGSHSMFHKDLRTLSDRECDADLRESREILETLLGRDVRYLAYPRGLWNRRVAESARRAGYTYAFTLPSGSEPVGPLSLPRIGIYRGNGAATFALKTTRSYLRTRMS